MRLPLCFILAIGTATATMAQEPNDPASWSTRYVAAKVLAAPLLRNATQVPSDAFKLSAESGDSDVSILLTREFASTASEWHLKLSAPLNKNAPRTTLADLKGLAADPSVEFGFGWTNKARATENGRKARRIRVRDFGQKRNCSLSRDLRRWIILPLRLIEAVVLNIA